jgi:hypothetical protein
MRRFDQYIETDAEEAGQPKINILVVIGFKR